MNWNRVGLIILCLKLVVNVTASSRVAIVYG